ncbi:MAG: tetratricopeptide repeat protein [Rhodospirillales bacterium]
MPVDLQTDQWGHPVTAAGADAVEALDETLMSYLALGRDTGELLKRMHEADPEMVMAHCLRGYFYLLMGSGPLKVRVPKALIAAEAGAAQATTRERAHVAALRCWFEDDHERMVRIWEAILADYPRDALALRLAHHAYFYMGAAGDMRASVERVLDSWDADAPGHGFVLGMRAFALEEGGEYAAAEETGRQAVEINPADPWAVHAVAHVMEMQDRHEEGIDWIESMAPHWTRANNFRYHLWWHRALMHLDRGETAETLRLYDEELWDPDSNEYLDLCNDASLLLRLELLGVEIGGRWRNLADKVIGRTDEQILAFIDCHYIAALAADGRDDAARFMLGLMRDKGGVFADVGVPVSEALLAHRANDYGRARDLLSEVRGDIVRIGGSHAQRDLFELLLIDATRKAGDGAGARALLAERTEAMPNDPWSWRAYADVLEGLGESAAAAEAEAKAAELVS